MTDSPKGRLIQSVDRALTILDELADRDEPIGLTELATTMGLDSSTVYRLLYTLRVHGYARQGGRDRRYRLGPKAIELGQKALQKFTLLEKGRPFLRELADEIEETATLVGLVGRSTVCLSKRERPGFLTFSPRIGAVAPPYCTATGKAVIANLPETELQQLLDSLELRRLTENTLTHRGALKKHLRMVREQGYAVDDEEYHPGIRCVAAPVFDHDGAVVGSIGISASASRLTSEKAKRIAPIVMDKAGNLSRSMGYLEEPE
jgi:DNA-binding IclR family transcriptional regulator